MKKITKIILLIILSAFISAILVSLPKDSFAEEFNPKLKYREFVNPLKPNKPAQGYDLFFDAMVKNAAYLCAWHGGHFFYKKDIVIDIHLTSLGVQRDHKYYTQVYSDSPSPPNKDDPYSNLQTLDPRTVWFAERTVV